MVAIAPIIQKRKTGMVSGVLSDTFASQTTSTTTGGQLHEKILHGIYTHVFLISKSGSLGYKGINASKRSVAEFQLCPLHHFISFCIGFFEQVVVPSTAPMVQAITAFTFRYNRTRNSPSKGPGFVYIYRNPR